MPGTSSWSDNETRRNGSKPADSRRLQPTNSSHLSGQGRLQVRARKTSSRTAQGASAPRAGHKLFDITIPYEDLLEHVAGGLDRKGSPVAPAYGVGASFRPGRAGSVRIWPPRMFPRCGQAAATSNMEASPLRRMRWFTRLRGARHGSKPLVFFAGWGLLLYLATDPMEAWAELGSHGAGHKIAGSVDSMAWHNLYFLEWARVAPEAIEETCRGDDIGSVSRLGG
jgi:hypothetical protein